MSTATEVQKADLNDTEASLVFDMALDFELTFSALAKNGQFFYFCLFS